jgi:hypothetical protein
MLGPLCFLFTWGRPRPVRGGFGNLSLLFLGCRGWWGSGGSDWRLRGVCFVCFSGSWRNGCLPLVSCQVKESTPRARGDGPVRIDRRVEGGFYSPRTRGWAPWDENIAAEFSLLPAHAGMGPSGRARRGWWSPAPRACGDPSHLDRYRVSNGRGTAIRRRRASGSGRRGPLTGRSHQPAAPPRDQPAALGLSAGPMAGRPQRVRRVDRIPAGGPGF